MILGWNDLFVGNIDYISILRGFLKTVETFLILVSQKRSDLEE